VAPGVVADLIQSDPLEQESGVARWYPAVTDVEPSVYLGHHPVPPGLILLPGATGQGKSVTSLMISVWIALSMDYPEAHFLSVCEPRARNTKWGRQLADPTEAWDAIPSIIAEFPPYLVADSFTQVIPNLASSKFGGVKEAAFKGGMQPSWISAISKLNSELFEAGFTLFATLNSDLFPSTSELEGAAEGKITLTGELGTFIYRDRSRRTPLTFTVPSAIVDAIVAKFLAGREDGIALPTQSTLSSDIN